MVSRPAPRVGKSGRLDLLDWGHGPDSRAKDVRCVCVRALRFGQGTAVHLITSPVTCIVFFVAFLRGSSELEWNAWQAAAL